MVKWHARISLFVHQRERNERSPRSHWESILCTRAIIISTHDRATPSIYGRVIRVFADGNSVSRGDPSLFVSRRRPKALMPLPPPQSVFHSAESLSFRHLMLASFCAQLTLILLWCFFVVWNWTDHTSSARMYGRTNLILFKWAQRRLRIDDSWHICRQTRCVVFVSCLFMKRFHWLT
jgi:hypothetical protein